MTQLEISVAPPLLHAVAWSASILVNFLEKLHSSNYNVTVADDDWTVLTADGTWSCHEEHTVAVFRDHTEVLTECEGLPSWA